MILLINMCFCLLGIYAGYMFLLRRKRWYAKKKPDKKVYRACFRWKINECSVKQQKANNGIIVTWTKWKRKSENGALNITKANINIACIKYNYFLQQGNAPGCSYLWIFFHLPKLPKIKRSAFCVQAGPTSTTQRVKSRYNVTAITFVP